MIMVEQKGIGRRKTGPTANVPTRNFTGTGLGLKEDFCGKRLATKILSHGTALKNIRMSSFDTWIFSAVILAYRRIYDAYS
jgi:hypothetical protein